MTVRPLSTEWWEGSGWPTLVVVRDEVECPQTMHLIRSVRERWRMLDYDVFLYRERDIQVDAC